MNSVVFKWDKDMEKQNTIFNDPQRTEPHKQHQSK